MVAAQRPRDWAPDRHLSQRAPCVPACVRAVSGLIDPTVCLSARRSALGALGALLGFEKVIEVTWFFSEHPSSTFFGAAPLSLYLAPTRRARPTDQFVSE